MNETIWIVNIIEIAWDSTQTEHVAEAATMFRPPGLFILTPKLAYQTPTELSHITASISNLPFALRTLIVAGGGVQNKTMMKMISDALPDGLTLAAAEDIGATSDMIEAELIAVLAARYVAQLPSTWPETTGASAAQIAGLRADPL